MPVRSSHLFGPLEVPAGPAVATYLCPLGRTAILRSVVLTWSALGGPAQSVRSALQGAGEPDGTEWWRGNVSAGSFVVLPYLVLDPGMSLHFALPAAAATGVVRVTGFGSLLLGEPM